MANNYMGCSFELLLESKEQRDDVLRFVEVLDELEETYYDDDEGNVPEEIQQFFREPLGDNDVDELYRSGHIGRMPARDGVSETDYRIWFYAEEAFNPNYFNLVLRYAMKKYRIERFGYSWAFTCSKPRLYQFGGEAVILYNYGENITYSCTEDIVRDWVDKLDGLDREDSNDYVLRPNHQSVWITVHDLSVYVRRNDDGVSVDIYEAKKENDESIAGTWALYRTLPEEADGEKE